MCFVFRICLYYSLLFCFLWEVFYVSYVKNLFKRKRLLYDEKWWKSNIVRNVKILKASINFMKVIYVVRNVKTTTTITITITKIDTMKRKENDMKKMKNIEKKKLEQKHTITCPVCNCSIRQHYIFLKTY